MTKRHAPAVGRNREAISAALADHLPASGTVLEIASGTGEHAVFLAERFPALAWQPSERGADELASINAWREDAGLDNLFEPVALDVMQDNWPVKSADALLCINMIHIAAWEAAEALFVGASRVLKTGAPLMLYGPFLEREVATAPSNTQFDLWLKARDPSFGIRPREDVDELAQACGFARSARHEMPANNLVLVYRRV